MRRVRDFSANRRVVASAAGALFGKAHALSEEVHMAMVARGYTGDAITLDSFRFRGIDVVFTGACVSLLHSHLEAAMPSGHKTLGRHGTTKRKNHRWSWMCVTCISRISSGSSGSPACRSG